jgi:hypothetical protein
MGNTAEKLETTSERKVIVVLGTVVVEGELKKLHAASCECGNRIWVSSKKESLNYYIEKIKGSCCGKKINYMGERFFKGKELIDTPTEVKKEENIEKTIPLQLKTPENKTNELIQYGRKGITNKQMVEAIIKHADVMENIVILFEKYPDIFKSSAKYVPDKIKVDLEKLIQTKDKNFKLPISKKTRLKLEENK